MPSWAVSFTSIGPILCPPQKAQKGQGRFGDLTWIAEAPIKGVKKRRRLIIVAIVAWRSSISHPPLLRFHPTKPLPAHRLLRYSRSFFASVPPIWWWLVFPRSLMSYDLDDTFLRKIRFRRFYWEKQDFSHLVLCLSFKTWVLDALYEHGLRSVLCVSLDRDSSYIGCQFISAIFFSDCLINFATECHWNDYILVILSSQPLAQIIIRLTIKVKILHLLRNFLPEFFSQSL